MRKIVLDKPVNTTVWIGDVFDKDTNNPIILFVPPNYNKNTMGSYTPVYSQAHGYWFLVSVHNARLTASVSDYVNKKIDGYNNAGLFALAKDMIAKGYDVYEFSDIKARTKFILDSLL